MKALLATAAAFAILALPASTGAVVGGAPVASIDDFPFQVELWNQLGGNAVDGFLCGGVILDATHVATAAHCVFDDSSGQVTPPSRIHVLAGTRDLNQPGTDETAAATSFDPRYDPSVNDYDVGVITLSNPLFLPGAVPNGTTAIAPVFSLVALNDTTLTATGNVATVSGWGYTHALNVGEDPGQPYPTRLQSAQLKFSDMNTCSANYGGLGLTVTPRMVCAADTGKDACFGDSGGPLVVLPNAGTAPDDYQLAGLVESGAGCAQSQFPGIFDRVSDVDVRTFATSQPPPAPQQQSPTTISGNAASGQTATCNPGGWSGGPTFGYEFFQDLGDNVRPAVIAGPSAQGTYTIKATDVGSKIFCVTKATAAGGYGYGLSDDLAGSAVTSPPPTTVKDTSKPTLSVARKSCSTRGRCVVNVQVSDRTPSSGIAGVAAKLRWRAIVRCHKRSTKRCTRTKTKTVKAKSIGGGHYLIVVSHLSPRTYGLILRAADKAGNHQRRTTYVTLRVKAKRS